MPSLQQTEAVERARLLTVTETDVTLDLTAPGDHFTSTSEITFSCVDDGVATFCDFAGVDLVEATLNGEPVDASGWTDGRLALSGVRAGENRLRLAGTMAYSSDGEGLHRHVDPDSGAVYLYAMSFLDAAPRWFGCFDQPDLKSRYSFTVTAPDGWVVRGNGPAVSVPTGEESGGATRTWRIDQAVPLSTYFTTLVAGDYTHVERTHDGITMGLLTRRDLADELSQQADDIFTVTAACFDAFHELFGVRYPFGEYHQAFVPDFNAGAMENPGCVTFRDQYVFRGAATDTERGGRACTIAHEMAHQWFGDLVTMRWWDDLWLNESFAEYLGHRVCSEATRYPRWEEFGIARKDWGRIADQAETSHPIAGNGAADARAALANFDGISYAKGAAVLKQLVAYLGDEAFFAGLNDYFGRYGRGNASFAELTACWQAAADRLGVEADIEGWSAQWLTTQGLDELSVVPGDDGVRLHRTPPADHPADRIHQVAVAAVSTDGRVRQTVELRTTGDVTAVPFDRSVDADDVLVADATDVSWARTRIDGLTALDTVAGIDDSLIRLRLYSALRDAVRDATLDPARALEQLVTSLPDEPTVEFVRDLGGFAVRELAGPFAAPSQRVERSRAIWEAAHGLIDSAQPGSDRQLVAIRLAIAAASDAGWLDELVDGGLPEPFRADRELLWQAVVARTALPVDVDRAEARIATALERDPSTAGRLHAATARALIPTPEAKQRALEIVLQPSEASAYEVYATADGLFAASQHDLTADLVEPFFARIHDTAGFRTGWALARVVTQAFPRGYSDPGTLRLAEAAIERPGTDPAIVRALRDVTDRLRRAVASRQRFDVGESA